MIRMLSFVVVLALVVAGAVWLADRPGTVAIDWLGWRIETVVPVLLAALVVLAALLTGLFRLAAAVVHAPGRWSERRVERRRHKGYQALSDGLAAAAAGDPGNTRKQAGRAEKLLRDPALTRVLAAQAAQLTGDAAGAQDHYTAMLDRPETAALGLRGLLRQALERGDREAAIDLARRARMTSRDDRGLAETLFTLLIKADRLTEAQDLLADAVRGKALPAAEANHLRALVLTERAGRAAAGDDQRNVMTFAKQALVADPGLTAAAVRLAGLYGRAGKPRRAAGVLERTWTRAPHPDLARAYDQLAPAGDALQRVRRLERLVAGRPDDALAHLILGEASLEAKLWGQARKHLLAAAEAPKPAAATFRLLARLEEGEYHDRAAAQRWLNKAAGAAADPTWLCGRCGAASESWALLCPRCGEVDSLAWAAPGVAPVALAPAK